MFFWGLRWVLSVYSLDRSGTVTGRVYKFVERFFKLIGERGGSYLFRLQACWRQLRGQAFHINIFEIDSDVDLTWRDAIDTDASAFVQ